MRINTRQLYNLNQVSMDLEDLLFHKPAWHHNIMEKLRIVIDKMHDKLARAHHLIYHIMNGCDICYNNGVLFK